MVVQIHTHGTIMPLLKLMMVVACRLFMGVLIHLPLTMTLQLIPMTEAVILWAVQILMLQIIIVAQIHLVLLTVLIMVVVRIVIMGVQILQCLITMQLTLVMVKVDYQHRVDNLVVI